MNWFSRLLRRKEADDGFLFDVSADGETASPWIPVPSAVPPTDDSVDFAAVGFSSAVGTLLGTGGRHGGRDRRYRQAFTPAQPVSEVRRLAGRTPLIRRVIRSIEDQDLHVVLYGDRGIGKTSVLKVVQGLALTAGYLVHYVSCGNSTTFHEVFRSLAARIPLRYDRDSDPTTSSGDGGGSLADDLPEGAFSVSQLTDILARVEGARILLILDEFDRSDVVDFRLLVGELIKNLSDRSVRVQLLIGGIASNLSELVAHVPSIRRNIVGIGIPNLTADEVDEMLDIAEAAGNVSFAAKARERLITVSAGLPYLVGLIGQFAVLEAVDNGDDQIALKHVDRAVSLSCEEIANRLSLRCTFGLDKLMVEPLATLIESAAAEATREGGVIVDQDLTGALLRNHERLADILEPIADDPRGGWRFVEDGASSLVWLRKATRASAPVA